MDAIVSNLLARYEGGAITRRELIRGLAILAAASGTAAAAEPQDTGFKGANIDHVSVQVTDPQRSVDFYRKTFGFTVVSQDKPNGIIRLGITKALVSLNHESPAGIVDHFAIGVPKFDRDSITSDLKQRGATPENDLFAGFHVKDPDGIKVQIFQM